MLDIVAQWLNTTVGMSAYTEQAARPLIGEDGSRHAVRADILVTDFERGVQYVIEVKTYDPRCAAWRDKDVDVVEAKLHSKGSAQYASGTIVRVLAVGADGTVGPRARKLLAELTALREEQGAVFAGAREAALGAELAVGLAQKEEACYREWQGAVQVAEAAECARRAGRTAVAGQEVLAAVAPAEPGALAPVAAAVAQK